MAEAAAIAVGVFLSLWADQWRENRNLAAEGRESLQRIAVDLARDTASLSYLGRLSGRGVVAVRNVLATPPGMPSRADSVAALIPWVLRSSVFQPAGEEFEALRSSGRLGLITNPELLSAISSYYRGLDYLADMYRYDVEQSHVVAELMYPHVAFPRDQFLGGAAGFPPPRVDGSFWILLDEPVFTNEMTYAAFLKELTSDAAAAAADDADELLMMIRSELGR